MNRPYADSLAPAGAPAPAPAPPPRAVSPGSPAPSRSVGLARSLSMSLAVSLGLGLALAACGGGGAGGDDLVPAADDATAEALRAVAAATGDTLAQQEGAPAPTNALGAAAPDAPPGAAAGAYTVAGAASEPEAVRAAETGALGRPLVVWFVAPDCEACAAAEEDFAAARAAWIDRVAFVTVDVNDAAAADVVRRLNVKGAPTFVILASSGSPAASFTDWPGAADFGRYLELILQQDAAGAGE